MDVCRGAHILVPPHGLLGCHEAGSSHNSAIAGSRRIVVDFLDQAKVTDLGYTVSQRNTLGVGTFRQSQQHVGRFQVAVNNTPAVGKGHTAGNLGYDPGGLFRILWLGIGAPFQCAARNEFK